MPAWLPELAASVFATIIAITLHEAAHGYAARALGDDTAARAGRLSLNPIRHVDMVGTILLPGFLLISQLLTIGRVEAMFGWAKPVPVNIWQLRNPRYGMVAVAAAGRGSPRIWWNHGRPAWGRKAPPLPIAPLDCSFWPIWCLACSTCFPCRRWMAGGLL